jgi:hypothetical protein
VTFFSFPTIVSGSTPHASSDDHGQFCCFGSRRISRWQSSRPCSADARPQTARRWATRRRPESREPLRPVAARRKPQATAGRRRELQIEAARQSPLYLDPAHGRCRTRSSAPSSARTPARPESRRPGVGPVLAGSAGRGRRRADVVKYWTGCCAGPGWSRWGRGIAQGRGGSRVTVGVQAGRRCWGWCCR